MIAVNEVEVVCFLSVIAVSLVSTYVGFLLLRVYGDHGRVFGLAWLFDLNREGNVPAFYSALILLLCSGLMAVIWIFKRQQKDSFARHWSILAIVLLYLSVDEASEIHELVSLNIKNYMDTGLLHYPFVVPGAIAVVIFAAVMARFTFNLPQKTRRLFWTAGIVYVGGAIGVETLGGRHHALYGDATLTYGLLVTLEESLEMAGVLVLVFALLAYMRTNGYELILCFRPVSN